MGVFVLGPWFLLQSIMFFFIVTEEGRVGCFTLLCSRYRVSVCVFSLRCYELICDVRLGHLLVISINLLLK